MPNILQTIIVVFPIVVLIWILVSLIRKATSSSTSIGKGTYSYDVQKTEYSKLPPDIFILQLENGKLQVSWNVFENVTHYLVYVNGIFSQTVHTNQCEIEPHESGTTRIGVCPVYLSGEQGEMGTGWITRPIPPIKETLEETEIALTEDDLKLDELEVEVNTEEVPNSSKEEFREIPPSEWEQKVPLTDTVVESTEPSKKKTRHKVDYPGQDKGFTKVSLRAIHKQVKKGISVAAVAREWEISRDTVNRMVEFIENENASKKVVKS